MFTGVLFMISSTKSSSIYLQEMPPKSALDVPENQDPNLTYPNTTWIKVNDEIHVELDLPVEGGEPGEVATVGFKMWIRTK
jgi:hypothetical protein